MTKKPAQPTHVVREQQNRDANTGQKDVWGIAHTADTLAKADSILSRCPALYLLD